MRLRLLFPFTLASANFVRLLAPQCWRFSVLAVGIVQGMHAGVDGFRA